MINGYSCFLDVILNDYRTNKKLGLNDAINFLQYLYTQAISTINFNYYNHLPCPGFIDEFDRFIPYEFSIFDISEAEYFIKKCEDYSKKYLDFEELYKKSVNLSNSQHKKRQRLRKHFESIFSSSPYVYFITYTFNDEDLQLRAETRRKQVREFFKSLPGVIEFIMNIDFGEKNNREHFHCCLSCNDELDFSMFPNNIDLERVPNFIEDKERVMKYLIKLQNHACKSSTGSNRVFHYLKK